MSHSPSPFPLSFSLFPRHRRIFKAIHFEPFLTTYYHRNPWGERASNGVGEWNGPWSDGSKEWTPYWLKKLSHRFGDDGVFWMSYEDMLETFLFLHRTRLFDEKWTVVQQWTSMNVGWVSGYLNNKFLVEIKKAGMVVFVLTQVRKPVRLINFL